MKKVLSYIGIFVLSLFSFYYTDKASEIVKGKDPIMKNIMSNKDNYLIEPVNALISGDEIVSGINGKSVDVDNSYKKMKHYNIYDEDMYVFKEDNPILSFINSYDKYVVGGNKIKNEIALVFKIVDSNYLDKLNHILLDKNIVGTLFVDGVVLEQYTDKILELISNGNQIENLGYDLNYSKDKIGYTNNMIESLTRKDARYCYTDYKNDDVLDICGKNNMYTIKPTISVSKYPFITVKNNIKSGDIVSFNMDSETIKELPSIISYLKQKGYKLVSLDNLISERYVDEK